MACAHIQAAAEVTEIERWIFNVFIIAGRLITTSLKDIANQITIEIKAFAVAIEPFLRVCT